MIFLKKGNYFYYSVFYLEYKIGCLEIQTTFTTSGQMNKLVSLLPFFLLVFDPSRTVRGGDMNLSEEQNDDGDEEMVDEALMSDFFSGFFRSVRVERVSA